MAHIRSVPISGASSGIGRVRIALPWWIAAAAHLVGLLPPRLTGTLMNHGKPALPTE